MGKTDLHRLDDDTISYFKRVKEVIEENTFQDQEDQSIFVENVFQQVLTKPVELCKHQQTSLILERLIPLLDYNQLSIFYAKLNQSFKSLATDRAGSHVVQTIIALIPKILQQDDLNEEKMIDTFAQLICETCQIICREIATLIFDTYACHILRQVLIVLSGLRTSNNNIEKPSQPMKLKRKEPNYLRTQLNIAVRKPFNDKLMDLTTEITSKCNFGRIITHTMSCPVLEILLAALDKSNKASCSDLILKIMDEIDTFNSRHHDNSSSILPCFSHTVVSRLFDKILQVASSNTLDYIYSKYLKDSLLKMSLHPIANHSVQNFIIHCQFETQMDSAINELSDYLEDILAVGNCGIIVTILDAGNRYPKYQKKLWKSLTKAFHIEENHDSYNKCVLLIISLSTYEVYFDAENSTDATGDSNLKEINHFGALILQSLLKYNNNSDLLKSWFQLKREELLFIACDMTGNHIIEAFIDSSTISYKKKKKLIDLYKGSYSHLACNKYGSRSLESCWRIAEINLKEEIAKELVEKESNLRSNFYGNIIFNKCNLQYFKKKIDAWSSKEEAKDRKRQTLSKILDEVNNNSEKAKRAVAKNGNTTDFSSKSSYSNELSLLGFKPRTLTTDDKETEKTTAASKTVVDSIDKVFEKAHVDKEVRRRSKKLKIQASQVNNGNESVEETKDMQSILSAITATKKKKKSKTASKRKFMS